ncbi:hypothetical protein GpartN1_g3527.t1 [Galdieria partita]|uniref:Secreted protein n=1 Tax=Galdieria partita TaxID=83374 RepID=A0A9C7PWB8_9RHOD|nr:hypothetical protein GpartN1_g3527.t1 [Galdieria partita]
MKSFLISLVCLLLTVQVIHATIYEVEVSYWFENTVCSGTPSEIISNRSSANCVSLENELWVQILKSDGILAGEVCEDNTCSVCEGAITSGACFIGVDDGRNISASLVVKEVSTAPTPTPSSVPKRTPTPKAPVTTTTPSTKQGSGNYDKVEINQQANINIS